MKKLVTLLLIVAVTVSCLFAWQETFTYDSIEYVKTLAFARMLNTEVGTIVTPVTGSQLLDVLAKLPSENLDEDSKAMFDELVASLQNPDFTVSWGDCGFDLNPRVNPKMFVHTNSESKLNDWTLSQREFTTFLELEGKVHFTDHIFGMIDFDWSNSPCKVNVNKNFFLNTSSLVYSDNSFPHKAYFAIGANHLNLVVGRDRVSLGNGETGNMIIGDNFWYQDFAKMAVYNGPFNYDLTFMAYDVQNSDKSYDFADHFNPMSVAVVHNFSFQYKWFKVEVNEGVLQYGDNIFEDLRFINPFFLLHNTSGFVKDTQNNFFGFEIGVTPFEGLEANVQVIFDQIQLKTELDENGNPSETTAPNAFGILANIKKTQAYRSGLLTYYVEGVYTSPSLYLKETDYHDESLHYWDVDLVVGHKLWEGADESYLGYKYGPDTIGLAVGAKYIAKNNDVFEASATFRVHGCFGIGENQQDYNDVGVEAFKRKTPTSLNGFVPEQRFIVNGSVDTNVYKGIDLVSEAALVCAWNYHNNPGQNFTDFQLSLGFKVNTLDILQKFFPNVKIFK